MQRQASGQMMNLAIISYQFEFLINQLISCYANLIIIVAKTVQLAKYVTNTNDYARHQMAQSGIGIGQVCQILTLPLTCQSLVGEMFSSIFYSKTIPTVWFRSVPAPRLRGSAQETLLRGKIRA